MQPVLAGPQCYVHTPRPAVAACVLCGSFICTECSINMQGRNHCKQCLERGLAQQSYAAMSPPQYAQGYPMQPAQQGYQMMPLVQQSVQIVHQAQKPGVNHAFHLIMSLVTFGFWLPIWGLAILINSC